MVTVHFSSGPHLPAPPRPDANKCQSTLLGETKAAFCPTASAGGRMQVPAALSQALDMWLEGISRGREWKWMALWRVSLWGQMFS